MSTEAEAIMKAYCKEADGTYVMFRIYCTECGSDSEIGCKKLGSMLINLECGICGDMAGVCGQIYAIAGPDGLMMTDAGREVIKADSVITKY